MNFYYVENGVTIKNFLSKAFYLIASIYEHVMLNKDREIYMSDLEMTKKVASTLKHSAIWDQDLFLQLELN